MSDNPQTPDDNNAPRWNREGLNEYRDSLSLMRREEEQRKLSRLFAEAATSPLLKEALGWATAHDLEFVVDRDVRSMMGAYVRGRGVLLISSDIFKPENRDDAVVTLVHEIRHAWQDWHGLLPNHAESFTGGFIRKSLTEADADAFGNLAALQNTLAKDVARLERKKAAGRYVDEAALEEARQRLQETKDKPAAALWQGFADWFSSPKPLGYGLSSIVGAAGELGLTGLAEDIRDALGGISLMLDDEPELGAFMNPVEGAAPRAGIPVADRAGLAPLGRDFSRNGNYFDAAPEGFLEKNILNPDLARDFYRAADKGGPWNGWVERVLQAEEGKTLQETRTARAAIPDPVRDEKRAAIAAERARNRATRKKSSQSRF